MAKHTLEELNNSSREELITMILMMEGQMEQLNENIERLLEQVRIANNYRFGKRSEKMDMIEGQISFFDEAEATCDESLPEPEADEVIEYVRRKKKNTRDLNLKDLPEEVIPPYSIPEEELDAFYGKGNWRRMPDETYKRLRT